MRRATLSRLASLVLFASVHAAQPVWGCALHEGAVALQENAELPLDREAVLELGKALRRGFEEPERAEERRRTLVDLATGDDSELRLAALEALADAAASPTAKRGLGRDSDLCAAWENSLDRGVLQERRLSARGLARAAGRDGVSSAAPNAAATRLIRRVQSALSPAATAGLERADPEEVLAILIRPLGRLLVELGGSEGRASSSEADWALLGIALQSPHGIVRRSAIVAIDEAVARLGELGRHEAAARLLELFAERGLDRSGVLDRSALMALFDRGDSQTALQKAQGLRRSVAGPVRLPGERLRLARALYVESLSLAAQAETEAQLQAADPSLDRAIAVLDALAEERLDLFSPEHRERQAEHGRLRALSELLRATLLLASPAAPSAESGAVLERARMLHRFALEAQLSEVRTAAGDSTSLESILRDELSPWTLLFSNARFPAWPAERRIAVQRELGRALATVAPEEVPGFAIVREGLDPISDPQRRDLLRRIQEARLEELAERIREIAIPAQWDDLLEQQLVNLRIRRLIVLQEMSKGEADNFAGLREQRDPCWISIWLANELREEGRFDESRDVARAAIQDLEESGEYYVLPSSIYAAELELAVGASFSDGGEPERAEEELEGAVRRLESLEEGLRERGAGPAAVERLRRTRSSALVSLAVNSNVKLKDPEKALEYFEEAYELRPDDDFMKVLLACYRARSGRKADALAVLETVIPGPGQFYNLACTFALMDETDRALDWLRRELEENHASQGSLERQKEWAREDPDLASLREEPRFLALTAPSKDQ